MGSSLGPALANILVGNYEGKLLRQTSKSVLYFCYVDVTFTIFNEESYCDNFLAAIDSLQPCLTFIFEKDVGGKFLVLEVLVEKVDPNVFTSLHQKPTFTGQYTRFGLPRPKTNLIGILMHRALSISSKLRLSQQPNRVKTILRNNGYPDSII